MKRTRNLKLPNGFGSIVFLGSNRRNPYGALKTTGWDISGKQIREYVGYAKTWNDAYKILLEYNGNPYDLEYKNITLEKVYDNLIGKIKEDCYNEVISKSTYSALTSTWNQQLSKIKNKKILDLRKKEIQKIINESGLRYTGRNYIKILFTKIINYCNEEYELNINKDICNLKVGEKEKSNIHKPFLESEISLIKEYAGSNDTAKMLMIYFYTGLRPSELLDIQITNIFLKDDYMIGGSKTEAGKERIIPIHPNIKEYTKYFYSKKNVYLIMNKNTNTKMTYDVYKDRFKTLMKTLNFDHKPHDTRHTFATKCEEVGISDINIKILIGHSLSNDITNDVYIHKSVERLKNEINKLKY